MSSEKAQVQKNMAEYLKNKYGMEFEVGAPYMTGSANASQYQAKAFPKDHPEYEFKINSDYYANRMSKDRFSEWYLNTKWSYQGRLEVEKKMREVYGEGNYHIDYYEFFANAAFKDLDYAQAFEKHEGIVKLHYTIFLSYDGFNKVVEASKVFDIFKAFIIDYKPDLFRFSVTYINKDYKGDYLGENRHLYSDFDKIYKAGKLLNFIRVENKCVINDYQELIPLYEY
jgi:hypothetical protein